MIKSSNLRRLSQLDLFQVISNILSFLQAEDLTVLQLQKMYDVLLAAFNVYDNAIIQSRKTGLTAPLNVLDGERDQTIIGFIECLTGLTRLPLAEKSAAAKELLEIVRKYPNIPSLPLRDETAAIENLLQDLKVPATAANISLLGLTDFVAVLEDKNTAYGTIYNERTTKEVQIQAEAAKQARTDLEQAFKNVANAINGLEVAFSEEPYRNLSNLINKEVERAKR